MSDRPAIVASSRAADRLGAAADWLRARDRGAPLLVIGATSEAAGEAVRRATAGEATFGWHRATLYRLAAEAAMPALTRHERAPASHLAVEAVCARVVADLHAAGRLGRYAPVHDRPGLPRALAATLTEVRLAAIDPPELPADLRTALAAYEQALQAAGLADRATVLRLAAEAIAGGGAAPWLDLPTLLVDVPVHTRREADLVRAMADRAPGVLATLPAGDPLASRWLPRALGGEPRTVGSTGDDPVRRLQAHLFAPGTPPAGDLGDDVVLLSAPGESRECVEIARHLHAEAARGVPFDRMAILLHAPGAYRPHVEEALRRADIPAWYARGTRRPDPAGRALLALLACRAEGLSASRFAEYLSLGELPDRDPEGAPPPATGLPDLYVTPDEDLVPEAVAWAEAGAPADTEPGSSLRAPRRWEQLLVDAAVIGGLDRWQRRLDGLAHQLALDLDEVEPDDPRAGRIERRIRELGRLRRFAMPLLEVLDALPEQASWGTWLDHLATLASRAVRHPDHVLAVLSELRPMAATGPVGLDEVRLVLRERLTDLMTRDSERRYGKVFVGSIDAARGLDFDVVFVPGLAERVFPQKVVEDPVLLDVERRDLSGLATNADRAEAERTALRLALGAACERVVFTWPRVDLDQGRPRVPSFYGLEVLRAAEGRLPGFDELIRRAEQAGGTRLGWPAPPDPARALDDAEYDLALLGRVFHGEQADAEGTARYLLGANPHLARALRWRGRRWRVRRFTSADGLVDPREGAVEALAAHGLSERSFSPTALQHFAACPYRFLLYTIHKLEPREEPERIEHIDPLSRGSLIHDAQFELLTALRDEGLLPVTPERLDTVLDRLDTVLDEVEASYRDDLAPAIDRVWRDAMTAVRADLREWLRRASRDVEWVPWRFELSFGLGSRRGRDEHSRPEPVELGNGLVLRGAIDLVERDAGGRLRATDHKTGRAWVREGAYVSGGEALQPVLYALAVEQMFPDHTVEAGRLYYCTRRGEYTERTMPLDTFARRVADEVVRVIGRWLDEGRLPAAPSEGACKWCDYRPVCGPWEETRVARVKHASQIADLDRLRSLK